MITFRNFFSKEKYKNKIPFIPYIAEVKRFSCWVFHGMIRQNFAIHVLAVLKDCARNVSVVKRLKSS